MTGYVTSVYIDNKSIDVSRCVMGWNTGKRKKCILRCHNFCFARSNERRNFVTGFSPEEINRSLSHSQFATINGHLPLRGQISVEYANVANIQFQYKRLLSAPPLYLGILRIFINGIPSRLIRICRIKGHLRSAIQVCINFAASHNDWKIQDFTNER